MNKVPGVLKVEVDLDAGEVTVTAEAGKVKPERLVDAVNHTTDSAHSFKARLKEARLASRDGS